jgi:hypothetical protein
MKRSNKQGKTKTAARDEHMCARGLLSYFPFNISILSYCKLNTSIKYPTHGETEFREYEAGQERLAMRCLARPDGRNQVPTPRLPYSSHLLASRKLRRAVSR